MSTSSQYKIATESRVI